MLEWPLQSQKSISISILGAWYLGIYGSGNGWVAHTEIYGCISTYAIWVRGTSGDIGSHKVRYVRNCKFDKMYLLKRIVIELNAIQELGLVSCCLLIWPF